MKHIVSVSLFLILAVVLSACGAASQPTPTAVPKLEVRYQLGWTHEYSSAGFYAAEKNGHYAEQNLNVTLVEGGFGASGYIEPLPQILDGHADFTLVSIPAV